MQGITATAKQLLQWGRGLSTAESRPSARSRFCGRRASMEPRSFDRGEVFAAHGGGGCRNFNGAAAFRSRRASGKRDPSSSPRCFNEAAVFRLRRAGLDDHARLRGQQASMRPRSFNRGEGLHLLRHRVRLHASMGPRSKNRGEACGSAT
jgi:hypothetical protein